jgi:competence protein ComGC
MTTLSRRNSPTCRRRRASAFTLLEVMTATAIMAVIILFVLSIATDTVRIYDNAISTLKTTSESRVVLGALSRDLETAVVRNDGNVWIEIEHEPEGIGNIDAGSSPKIMFFTSAADRRKWSKEPELGTTNGIIPGSICAVNYQIGHRSPFDNPGDYIQQIYGFYRAIVDARGTFEILEKYITQGEKLEAGAQRQGLYDLLWKNGSAMVLGTDGTRKSATLSTWVTEPQNFKATNVVGLSVVIYYENNKNKMEILAHESISASVSRNLASQGLTPIPKIEQYSRNVKILAGKIYADGREISANLKSMDIAVTVLSPDGDKILRSLQRALKKPKVDPERFAKIVREHGEVFTTSIALTQQ